MKHLPIAIILTALVMWVPMMSLAMSHGSHDEEKSSSMSGMEHKGHDMEHMDHDMEHKDHDMKMEDHGHDMDDMHKDHDMHKGHDMHDMKESDDQFVEIGKDTQKGVVATVRVKTYDEKTMATMAKMGMVATHHVMVFFTDAESGEEIDDGKAALKIKDQDGKPVMLMQMGSGFGSDVSLEKGMHSFDIGTRLEDGKQRQFSIMFHNM